MEKFGNTVEYHTGYTYEEVAANEGLQIMYAMVEWSFANLTEEGVLVAKKSGRSWDLESSFPTEEDFFQEMTESYGGDAETYWQIEGIGRGDLIGKAKDQVIASWAAQDENWDGGVKRISGIERVGDRLIKVTLEYYDVSFLDTLCDVYLAPMHWYGNESEYDYAAGRYGFPTGDLSSLKAKNSQPMGAGSHKLEITAYISRQNAFGPLHLSDRRVTWIGPNAWFSSGDAWTYEYNLYPEGITTAVQLNEEG